MSPSDASRPPEAPDAHLRLARSSGRALDRWATRALAAFFAAGALLVATVTALGGRERPLLASACAGVAALGALLLATRRLEANVAVRHAALLCGTALIGAVVVSSGRAGLADEALFVWVGLYGGFFVGNRALVLHLLVLAAVCVAALLVGADGMPVGDVAGRSVDVVGASAAAAAWSAVVRSLVDRSIATEVRRANTDALSGLANRRQLEGVGAALDRAGGPFAVVAIDLDGFKAVNDRHGHAMGDALLQAVAERLRRTVASRDTVARVGGDEFVVVMEDVQGAAVTGIARRIAEQLGHPYSFGDVQVEARASVGAARSAGGAFRRTLERADRVMYRAKRSGAGWAGDDGTGRGAPSPHAVDGPEEAVPETADAPSSEDRELAVILDARAVRSVFQPLVELSSGRTVGYEALARGPEGAELAGPLELFAAAGRSGRTLELEWLCRTRALDGAGEVLPEGVALFMNVEPASLAAELPSDLAALTERVARERTVVAELTERALVDHPAAMLRAVAELRALGCAIALDDVGADPRSAALIPYVRPEVIKLDLRLVQQDPTPALAATVHAVSAAAERSGSVLLAEGIETEEQAQAAIALGATHGQGWHFGRPAARPVHDADGPTTAPRWALPRAVARPVDQGPTPFELVSGVLEPRVGSKRMLYSISKYLEHHLAAHAESSVLLSTFQHHSHFSDATRRRYARLAATTAFTAVFGEGMPEQPAPRVRGVPLGREERLCMEWDVVVVTPHLAAAFVARDLGDEDGEDWERRFEFVLTYDRDVAVAASSALMVRVGDGPAGDDGPP